MNISTDHIPARNFDILVVENHPDTLRYVQMYLEDLGHRVRVATSVQEALQKLHESLCDVLISDIGLPDGDGWELMREARLPRSVYAIAMSGFGMGEDRGRSEAAGFRHHLSKPFDPEELEHCLDDAARELSPPRPE